MSWLTAFLESFRSGLHCFWSEKDIVFRGKTKYPSYPARKPRASRPRLKCARQIVFTVLTDLS